MTLKQTLFRIISVGIGATAVEFYSGKEKLGSTPNATRKSGNVQARNRVGVSEWKTTKKKHEQ